MSTFIKLIKTFDINYVCSELLIINGNGTQIWYLPGEGDYYKPYFIQSFQSYFLSVFTNILFVENSLVDIILATLKCETGKTNKYLKNLGT
jgi:hypothetical protein